jgi:hypothetical protein
LKNLSSKIFFHFCFFTLSRTILEKSSDYFSKQHYLFDLHNQEAMCLLVGRKCIFMLYSDLFQD